MSALGYRLADIGGLLDRIAWASLPPDLLLRRSAAWIRERVGDPRKMNGLIDHLSEKLAYAPDEAAAFGADLRLEVIRQHKIAATRWDSPARNKPVMRAREERTQVTALSVFGAINKWWVGPHPGHVTFSHLRIYQPGVVVALLRTTGTYKEHRLVFRVQGAPTQCVSLPVTPKNLNDAFVMLGLNKVSTKGARLSIDWIGKAFIVNNYHSVPWDCR